MMAFRAFKAATHDHTITYHIGPACSGTSRGLLVLVHGRSRSMMHLAEAFGEKAQQEGFSLLLPVFDVETYDDFQILRGRSGPRAASDALDAACEDAARHLGIAAAPFALVGFSAGAQFAHRYSMRFPKRVTALVAAGAGWYTMPNPRLAFPFGCAPSIDMPEGIQDLDAFLRIPTRVMVGDRDVHRDSRLRASPALDEDQGMNRLERARRWVDAVSRYAAENGVSARVSLEILPRCGHSAAEAIRNGGFVERSISLLANHQSSYQSVGKEPIHD